MTQLPPDSQPFQDQTPADCSTSTTVTVFDPLGLHLRKGRDVVRVANRYQSTITAQNLSRGSSVVDVKSILQLIQLQARQGHILRLDAVGSDAHEALEALQKLFDPNAP